eukprot:gene22712-29407_t
MSSAANLDEYISSLERNIKNDNRSSRSGEGNAAYSKDEILAKLQKKYEFAQILTSVGRQKEAVEYFREAFLGFHEVKDNSIWTKYYCSVGAQYAAVLDYLSKYDKAEEVYTEILQVDPLGYYIGEFAIFLHRRKRDFDQAQSFYIKALQHWPEQSSLHLKYAGFLRHIRRDVSGAERHYKKSVELNPNNADALGNYASFLHGVYNDTNQAEKLYKQAVRIDNTHTNNLCNYGLFLSEERREFKDAEKMYRRALEVNPKHANTLYNYAVMLDTHLKRKEEAESTYRTCLHCEPKHAFALYNLAVLLEERLFGSASNPNPPQKVLHQKKDEILGLYRKAVEADPRDASTMADYGRFLLVRMDDASKGQQVLQAALKMNPGCEIALYHLAVMRHRQQPPDLNEAAEMLKTLLSAAPQHANGHLQLARVLSDVYRRDAAAAINETTGSRSSSRLEKLFTEISIHYEQALASQREPGDAALEYLKIAAAFATSTQKRRIVEICSVAVNHGMSAVAAIEAAGSLSAAVQAEIKALHAARSWIEKINNSLSES